MKEWIYKDGSGEYVLTTDPEVANLAADAIEVPDGAEKLIEKQNGSIYFVRFRDGLWNQYYISSLACVEEEWIEGSMADMSIYEKYVVWQRTPNQKTIDAMNDDKTEEFDTKEMCEGCSKPKHSHYKKDVSHLNVIDPYRIADLYDLHPCAEHIMKKSLCAGGRGHKDLLRDIQDIIDTAERWKEMIEEDNNV